MNICIFEDSGFSDLLPLTYTRPVFDLRCGIFTLREKIEINFPDSSVTLACRNDLAEVLREEGSLNCAVNSLTDDDILFINGRAILDEKTLNNIDSAVERVFMNGADVVAAMLKKRSIDAIRSQLGSGLSFDHLKDHGSEPSNARVFKYYWDLVNENEHEITKDFEQVYGRGEIRGIIYPKVSLIEQENIFVGPGTAIKSGTVLDAENGPIYIGKDTKILPNVTIIGPVFIGDNCTINAGAKIYQGTSIGKNSKVGGEIAESIIQSFSNKQHDGFIGHTYMGEWVNLGADTNNSDLKNNYSDVYVEIKGKEINSKSQFVGSAIGDHSKTGINTMLNTGTVIGVFANVFGGGFPPKAIPSFSWGGASGFSEYNFEKSMLTAERVMKRRQKELKPVLKSYYRKVFEITKEERLSAGIE